jgi:hypothetical protein
MVRHRARRETWSRVLALTLALLNALLFSLGTVLAFYTLWVLLQEDVRVRFEKNTSSAHPVNVS